MSQLIRTLGYGKSAVIEMDTFTRILNNQIADNEEIRKDWSYPFEYVAIAPAGSNTTDFVWSCVRCTWNNNHKERIQYRENLAWDSRAEGWI